jgi:hypothetical protein
MRIKVYRPCRQAKYALVFLAVLALCSCGKKENIPVIPPATSPLSRESIGFGVVNVSYSHVTAQPEDGSASLGYLRRGTVVRILERKMIRNSGRAESWVLADGGYRGWLRETAVDIYDNEMRARTASEFMGR